MKSLHELVNKVCSWANIVLNYNFFSGIKMRSFRGVDATNRTVVWSVAGRLFWRTEKALPEPQTTYNFSSFIGVLGPLKKTWRIFLADLLLSVFLGSDLVCPLQRHVDHKERRFPRCVPNCGTVPLMWFICVEHVSVQAAGRFFFSRKRIHHFNLWPCHQSLSAVGVQFTHTRTLKNTPTPEFFFPQCLSQWSNWVMCMFVSLCRQWCFKPEVKQYYQAMTSLPWEPHWDKHQVSGLQLFSVWCFCLHHHSLSFKAAIIDILYDDIQAVSV